MKPLLIPPTEFSPKFYFDPEISVFEISGYSRPEDVSATYLPVINYINEFEKTYLSDPDNVSKTPFIIKFKMKYFNSSSSKYILDILNRFITFQNKGLTLKVEWYYEKNDDTIREAGEDFADITEFHFDFIETEN